MGSAANIANVPQILKNIWRDDIFNFMYEEQPFLGLVTKTTDWDGLFQLITVMYGGMAGRSNTFGEAKANKSPPKYAQMQVGVRDNFATWSVDHKLITLSRNQRGALVRALTESTEKATSKLKRSSCWMFWRDGGGSVARIKTISTNTFTLYDVNDIRNFDLDDVLEFSVDSGIAGAGVLAGSLVVTGLDEDLGIVTVDQNVTNIPTLAANYYVFHKGDYNLSFSGVPAYVTLTAPGTGIVPASIWGMPRTNFPTRLAGSRFQGSNLMITEAIKKALALGYRRNIETTHIFAPPEVYNDVEMSLGSQRMYTDEKVGTVGYQALNFTMQGGKTVKMYSDADIPRSPDATTRYVFGVNLPTWKFQTADDYPMWLASVATGGGKFMVEQNTNSSEGRLGGYGQLYTIAPGQNWNLALT